MPELTVRHKSGEYPIIIRDGIRFQLKEYLKKNYSSILIVTDEAVEKLYLNDVKSSLRGIPLYTSLIPSGEASKSMDVYARVLTEAIENGLDRNSLIIALGGGVVGDLAGFAAATFMRGIDYIQVPTTILAHDSSVGGKVAINHPLGKNLIGSFYPPAGVYYDIGTLHTLSAQEVRSGYAELIKEAFISDGELVGRML
jgi:3-dehydroquinate synthase